MERSKGLILIVVGLAAALIVWKVGFGPADQPKQPVSTANKQTNTNTENPQPVGNTPDLLNAQPERPQQGNENFSRNQRGTRGGFNSNMDPRGMGQSFENIGMKIAIPDKLSEAELRVLYEEYTQISRTAGGRNRGGRGGMMGGGMMGGGMMGGDMMGGGRGGMGGDMGMGGFGG
jgi:hypothetical protein